MQKVEATFVATENTVSPITECILLRNNWIIGGVKEE